MNLDDTIVAISSPAAPAARMIVRLSGSQAGEIAAGFVTDLPESGARPVRIRFVDATIPGWAYVFRAPRSATGEDVVELHLPGNPLIARRIVGDLLAAGARPAGPGEFTARAYFNGRIDLSQAEGVAATISAAGDAELRAARQLLAGELGRRLSRPMESLTSTLALVEAGIDFSDQDVSFLSPEQLIDRVAEIDGELGALVADSRRFARVGYEPAVALVGRPNAGKSTLLNALCGHERAVVSPHAGTTRDLIWAHVPLLRGMIRLIDAAGIDANQPADDAPASRIARTMHERARQAVQSADYVLMVRDATDARPPPALPRNADLLVLTKQDLAGDDRVPNPGNTLLVSSITGFGLDGLRKTLDALVFGAGGGQLWLNDRHLEAISESRAALRRARDGATSGWEIVALELREALDSLGRLLGQVTPDDVLGRIFGSFCIGK